MKIFAKLFFVLFIAAFVLSACGKVSAPVPIEGSGYPHSYPRR